MVENPATSIERREIVGPNEVLDSARMMVLRPQAGDTARVREYPRTRAGAGPRARAVRLSDRRTCAARGRYLDLGAVVRRVFDAWAQPHDPGSTDRRRARMHTVRQPNASSRDVNLIRDHFCRRSDHSK